jgi:hypothetical protein
VCACIDFIKAYDSGRREVFYNIFIEFGIPMKLVRLIKMCLTETYGRVQVGKNRVNQYGLKLNSAHQHLVYADDINILGVSIHTTKENAEALVVASKENVLEVNADKSKYMVMS